ncbi:cell envelope integrity protein TolA [Variovorax boronicumulans]|uniref:cell envelope integrity protein TolA n=1 Tax=Variovorax boronicumulans TaxID=436515 RepID=UPI0012FE65D0|nr:cell envelope integrity protein TolA [Variovorax boronicumulans]
MATTLGLTGCGYSTNSERAVKNATIDELMAATMLQRHHGQSDFSNRVSAIRAKSDGKFDVAVSRLSDSKEVSDLKISRPGPPAPKGDGIVGQYVHYEFRLGGKYDVKARFLVEVRTYGFLSLAHWPALDGLTVSREGVPVYSGLGVRDLELLHRMIAEQDVTPYLDGAWKLVQAEKARAAVEQERLGQEKLARQQAEDARRQADDAKRQEIQRLDEEKRAQAEKEHLAMLDAIHADQAAKSGVTSTPQPGPSAQAKPAESALDQEAQRIEVLAREQAKAWMDTHWKDNPRDNEANNKRTYDMNYRRKVNEFSSKLRRESGKS